MLPGKGSARTMDVNRGVKLTLAHEGGMIVNRESSNNAQMCGAFSAHMVLQQQ